jgi:hypothetical protein
LLSQEGKSFKPIHEKLSGLDAFYTGIGYVAPQKSEGLLKQLVEHLPDIKIFPMPLSQGQTFESFKLSHKVSYFQDLLIKIEGKLLQYKQSFNSEEITEEMIPIAKHLTDTQKKELSDLLHEKVRLQKQIEWAKGMEKALKESGEGQAPEFITMRHRLESLDEKLKKVRGQAYLGLCQKTITEIDNKLLGLRKFILLAAAPNIGKTALTIQLAIDILRNHEEACLIFFSLEMQESDIFTRMYCNLSQMDYKTFVLGRGGNNRKEDPSAHHSTEELKAIESARTELAKIGNRLQIVDASRILSLDSKKAISFINEIKEKTKTTRAIVVIDYLQVWPIPEGRRFASEVEIDKWRIEEIKKIRDGINDDPVIAISEARKPQGDSKWAGDMSDVMGTARCTYSPDAVFLFSQLDYKDISSLWATDWKIGKYQRNGTGPGHNKPSDGDIEKVCDYLENNGISLCRLDMPKGRDGMQKFSVLLEFHYRKNIFKPANFAKIKADSKKSSENPQR